MYLGIWQSSQVDPHRNYSFMYFSSKLLECITFVDFVYELHFQVVPESGETLKIAGEILHNKTTLHIKKTFSKCFAEMLVLLNLG